MNGDLVRLPVAKVHLIVDVILVNAAGELSPTVPIIIFEAVRWCPASGAKPGEIQNALIAAPAPLVMKPFCLARRWCEKSLQEKLTDAAPDSPDRRLRRDCAAGFQELLECQP